MLRLAYHPRYNLGFPGAQRLHPFDLRKYARAWRELKSQLGPKLNDLQLPIAAPATDEQLSFVHSPDYLHSLKQSAVVATAIEVPTLRRAPWWLLDRFVLQPMRWATAGTIAASRAALDCGLAFNLGGGFHHAKPDRGEGFSIYNDIAIAVHTLRHERLLAADSRIAYIDLDAHLGNGVAWCFRDDSNFFHFDVHNAAIYPTGDTVALNRVDCPLPLNPGCTGREYQSLLERHLPPFLDSISRSASIPLAIYNAGTDVLTGDPLGCLDLTLEDILTRDLYVIRSLRNRQIPTAILTSGGYTKYSYLAIANTILAITKESFS
jgi:histone deacetylase 11